MAADPLIYCLKELTDYDQFERLCHDLMALEGHPGIEPLGVPIVTEKKTTIFQLTPVQITFSHATLIEKLQNLRVGQHDFAGSR